MAENRLMTIREAVAAYPGLDQHTIRRAIAKGRLSALQLLGESSMIRIKATAIETWLEQSQIHAQERGSGEFRLAPGGSDTDFSFDY